MTGCDEGVWGRGCAIGVFTGDEAVGCSRGGVDECETRKGEVGIVGQVAGTVGGGDLVKLLASVRQGATSELSGRGDLLSGFGGVLCRHCGGQTVQVWRNLSLK